MRATRDVAYRALGKKILGPKALQCAGHQKLVLRFVTQDHGDLQTVPEVWKGAMSVQPRCSAWSLLLSFLSRGRPAKKVIHPEGRCKGIVGRVFSPA